MIVNDLEDKIMSVWGTADDIDLVLNWLSNAEPGNRAFENEDELMNLLIGIKALHRHRCHVLFKDFEKVLASSRETEEAAVGALANAAAAEQLA